MLALDYYCDYSGNCCEGDNGSNWGVHSFNIIYSSIYKIDASKCF